MTIAMPQPEMLDPFSQPSIDADRNPVVRIGRCLDAAFALPGHTQRPFGWDSGLYSLPSLPLDDPAGESRRAEDRIELAVYRSAMLRWGDHEALCLIRNISPGGAMGKMHAAVPHGEHVTVEIRSGQPIGARIAWAGDGLVGVQFDHCVDLEETLHVPTGRGDGLLQRMPRLRVPCPINLVSDGVPQAATLLDVSQGGAKIAADGLREGEEVTLSIADLAQRRGMVRWTRDGQAGIAFLLPIAFDLLAKWGEEHRGARA